MGAPLTPLCPPLKLRGEEGGGCRNGTQIVMDRIRTEPVVYT